MAKNYSQRKRTRKSIIAALCALSITCTGLAAACTPDDGDDDTTTPAKEDTQLLKNGNFEFFDVPKDAVYLINNVNSWTLGGDSSVKSGIVNTAPLAWEKLVADDLADKLEYNNDIGTSGEGYIDYNSMRAYDVPYKDPYSATLEEDKFKNDKYIGNQGVEEYFGIVDGKITDKTGKQVPVYKDEETGEYFFDDEHNEPVRLERIANPETHLNIQKDDTGYYYTDGDGKRVTVYSDDDGNLFEDEDKENSVGNVLMVHNYSNDGKYNGLQQYYSSTTITLEANTAAEISVWVKTSDLKFDKGYSALDEQDKGAFIEVLQTVNGTTIDSFVVKNINTEKIIKYAKTDNVTLETESNGWLQYTVYVNACDFAASTIQLRLGLGREDDAEKCTGYAFFDDVSVTRYRDLESEGCTYSENATTIANAKTSCTLTSEEDDKVFNADKELRVSQASELSNRHSYDFYYAIDLASERKGANAENVYQAVTFGDNVTANLTTEKDGSKTYASASEIASGVIKSPVKAGTESGFDLVKNFVARPTNNDLIGVYGADANFSGQFTGMPKDYASLLNDALTGEGNDIKVLPKYGANSNMLVMLSAWGAAYTSTIDNSFTVEGEGYQIVSFWVKTSDLGGKPAATIKIYQVDKDGKAVENMEQSLSVESTNITTNFEDDKDIYNGWVQCFFFIENKTDETASYKIDFSYGNTAIKDATSYDGGWAALANMQTLTIDEEVYKLATAGDRTALLSITDKDDDNSGKVMDEATGTSDIKTGIATPSNYNGINGANSSVVSGVEAKPVYDSSNNNALAGLINKEYAENYAVWNTIATNFGKASANWDEVFGKDCYQPLIIINSIRQYVEKATATEENYTEYYVAASEGEAGAIVANGKYYKPAAGTEWDENATYYTNPTKVSNYGFVANTATVSANSYQTVSVRVMVSGDAKAYIYLVDTDNPKSLLSYTTPAFTFWYDEEGNVLDEEYDADWKETEHRSHIVYKYNDTNGLYEKYPESDGKTYANLYNLVKNYRNYKFEHNKFYDENGKEVSFDDLVNGETYYSDANKTTVADHYLTNTAGTRVYEVVDGKTYYLEKGERTVEVTNFDKDLARYDYTALNEKLYAEVEDTNGQWKTVNFLISTGSESKTYRLELWNGARDEVGDTENAREGAVAFDYSGYSVTSDNYANVIGEYETNIINAYKQILREKGEFDKINSNEENIAYYEELLSETEVASVKEQFGDYTAKYYNYTLYDSAAYVPFNASTAADGETGYDYNASDFGEKLAYFTYNNEAENSYNVFVDYSAVDQSISINNSTDDDDTDDDDDTTDNGNLGLYITSIVLVVVLLITLLSLLLKELVKKFHVKKADDKKKKNVYRQRDRYIKKLHLVKNEEVPADDGEVNEEPAEEATEEVPEETTEEVTEETTEEVTEEVPVEEVTEETPSEESEPEDNGENE